jgi:hypothetical protein
MKIAPIIDALNDAETRGGSLRFRLIHTAQHYDRAMADSPSILQTPPSGGELLNRR